MKQFACLFCAALLALAGSFLVVDQAEAGPISAHAVDQGGQDVHFLNEKGEIVRGKRCAAPNPSAGEMADYRKNIEAWIAENGITGTEAIGNIPVAFHVVYQSRRGTTEGNIPQQWIDDQIDVLNAAFAGTGFGFSLSSVDRTNNRRWFNKCDNFNAESQMKSSLAISPATTLNIYTCKPGGGILGYAYLPNQLPENDPLHGVVLLYSSLPGGSAAPYNLGDTGTHEVGHYLGLYHTFQNGCSAPGDYIADTPYEASPAFGCPVGRDTCASAGLDPIYNFMDYTDDACMNTFTSDQAAAMQAAVATYKPSL
ncbi:MAG: zinc metalloprotease [Acidobacteriota bacterium]|nr:zinc metalloprotease [Acidobacteriota bacterium]